MNTEQLAILGIIFLALAFLFSQGMGPNGFMLAQNPLGWTTLSLTQAVFSSSTKFFTGKVWILTVAQGGMGQHAEGTISASQVKDMSGTQPANNLKLSIDYSKMDWEYPIKVDYTSTPVYHYELYSTQSWNPLFDVNSWVKSKCPHVRWYGKIGGLPPTYWCIDQVQKTSYMGYLDSCQFHFTTKITVEAKGQTYSKTIDSKKQISTYIGPYVYVIWNGNMIKQRCPATTPYKLYYMRGWKIGSNEYYGDYKAKYNYLVSTMALVENRQMSYDLTTLKRMVDPVNTYGDRYINSIKSFGTIQYPSDVSKAFVSLGVSSDVQVPVYTFYVKADWLGIYQPTPKPQILDARGTSFKSGESGYLYVQFKNVGETGNFAVWAECQSPVYVMDNTKTYSVPAGGTTTAYIRVGYNGYQHVTASCNIYVQAQGTNYIVSRTVGVTADPQSVCQAGKMICDGPRIKQCNKYGSGWNLIKTCGEGEYCTYVGGTPKCVSQQYKPTPQPTPNPFAWLQKMGSMIQTVIILIVAGLVIVIIFKLFKK